MYIPNMKKIQMFFGSGGEDEGLNNILENSLQLINNESCNQITQDSMTGYEGKVFVKNLYNNTHILPSITYIVENQIEEQAREESNGAFEPPAISLKYNCELETLILHINYVREIVRCDLAEMVIHTNAPHHNFIWKLELSQIMSSIETLKSSALINNNSKELVAFKNPLGKKMIIYFYLEKIDDMTP
ncbi:unnamed protein product [Adineta steineri]|uniref:Uncharacterized protein n=1 Tax=Adineta steineri TaxID=433720 RepID=A0A815CY54_9BILA|nr:unnamed protein product [Adineta steineri]CAF1293958.1 unnamed protein product [Adineta steineri]